MIKRLKSVPLWASVLTLTYLIVKNRIGIEVPVWNDISEQLITILSILCG